MHPRGVEPQRTIRSQVLPVELRVSSLAKDRNPGGTSFTNRGIFDPVRAASSPGLSKRTTGFEPRDPHLGKVVFYANYVRIDSRFILKKYRLSDYEIRCSTNWAKPADFYYAG